MVDYGTQSVSLKFCTHYCDVTLTLRLSLISVCSFPPAGGRGLSEPGETSLNKL